MCRLSTHLKCYELLGFGLHSSAIFRNRETAKLDALIAKVREGIEKLKEDRIALVSAAVTGKIYVREAAA